MPNGKNDFQYKGLEVSGDSMRVTEPTNLIYENLQKYSEFLHQEYSVPKIPALVAWHINKA